MFRCPQTYGHILYVLHPPLSLLLLFSNRLCRFSSLSLASSSSCCWRHLWKFSTTTPTNMLSTKKLTMRRKEIKNSSIQGLLFLIGCREIQRENLEKRGGEEARGQKERERERRGPKSDKRGWGRVERKKRREDKQEDNVNPESAVKLQALSTHIYLSVCPFSFLTPPSSPEIFPLSAWNKRDQMVPETDTKQNQNTVNYNIHWLKGLYDSSSFFTSDDLSLAL